MRKLLERIVVWLAGLSRPNQAMLGIGLLLVVFTVSAIIGHPHPAVLASVYIGLGFALFGLVLRRLRFDLVTVTIILGGMFLYLSYLGYTTYAERNYDGPAQLEYINYITEHKSLPAASYCFICHHPPVYYVLAAIAYAFFDKTRLVAPLLGLQIFSLLIFVFFVVYGVLLVRRFTSDLRRIRLATALIVFWPYSVHNSIRVHNDTLVSSLMVVALYFVVCWYQDERPRDLYLGAVVTALGLMTKSSAFILVALLLLVLAVRFFPSRDKLRFVRRAGVVLAIVGAALFLNTLGKGKAPSKQVDPDGVVDRSGLLCQKLLGSACDIGPHQWVGNDTANYVYFDVGSFLKEPYMIADRDDTGRQYFWNHLIKSSLFGTHNSVADRETAYELNRKVAGVINFLTFGMLAYMLVGLTFVRKADARRYLVLTLFLGLCVLFMMGFRILIPAPHHTDFRHVFPMLVPVSLLYVNAIGTFRSRGLWLERLGYWLAIPFMVLTVFYFLPKYDWAMRVTARTVQAQLSQYATVVPEGSAWDRKGNLLFEGNETLEFKLEHRQTVSEIDVSFDNNDRYEIKLHNPTEIRTLQVGPTDNKKGLVRYIEEIDPPLPNVGKITVRAISGDKAYSMGHIILH